MRLALYLLSGFIFGIGLLVSQMVDPLKVRAFLSLGFFDWNPALLFVLGSAAPVYLISFLFLRQRKKTLNGLPFAHPAPRPIDKKLILGATVFGIGWGMAGICPGPALVHIGFLDLNFGLFIIMMFLGFELQRRFT
jgi:uncharacterized membrane protein YedE/YeeE